MKCLVTTLGGYPESGEETVVADLDDIGPIKLREMEIASPEEIRRLLQEDDVQCVEFEQDSLSEYDVHMTVVCDDLL